MGNHFYWCSRCGEVATIESHTDEREVVCPTCGDRIVSLTVAMGDADETEYRLAEDPSRLNAPESVADIVVEPKLSIEELTAATAAARVDESVFLAGLKAFHPRRRAYLFFAIALAPLALRMFMDGDDLSARFAEALGDHPEVTWRLEKTNLSAMAMNVARILPEKRLEGAHLSADSGMQWLYACEAAAIFGILTYLSFPSGNVRRRQGFAVAALMATSGVAFLLATQWLAKMSYDYPMFFGFIPMGFWNTILSLIGYSYYAAADPNASLFWSFVGFSCGVGLCEELVKAMPTFLYIRGGVSKLNWEAACFWGFASGLGFGVAEGAIYCMDYYNGIAGASEYFVRFTSCVALQAFWSAAAALTIWRDRERMEVASDNGFVIALTRALSVPIFLHGLFDTCMKRELSLAALVVATLSFGWTAFLIERTRREIKRMPKRLEDIATPAV